VEQREGLQLPPCQLHQRVTGSDRDAVVRDLVCGLFFACGFAFGRRPEAPARSRLKIAVEEGRLHPCVRQYHQYRSRMILNQTSRSDSVGVGDRRDTRYRDPGGMLSVTMTQSRYLGGNARVRSVGGCLKGDGMTLAKKCWMIWG
jgi:hypothetical protein